MDNEGVRALSSRARLVTEIHGVHSGAACATSPLLFPAYMDNSPSDCAAMQEDINSLCWASAWKVAFYVSKCFIIHVLHKDNLRYCLYSIDITLEQARHHSKLSVEFTNDLLWARHMNKSVSGANKMLGLIKETCGIVNHLRKRLFAKLL